MPITGDESSRVAIWAPEIGVSILTPQGVRSFNVMGGAGVTTTSGLTDGEATAIPQANRPREFQFSAEWVAETNSDDLRPVIVDLWRLIEKMKSPRRKPIVYCSYAGQEVIQEGWVSRLDIRYMHGVHDAKSPIFNDFVGALAGNPAIGNALTDIGLLGEQAVRAFVADVSIVRAQPRAFAVTGEARQRETSYRRIGAGETFESIAMTHFGDPYKGVLLRRINPEIAQRGERVNDVVKVLEPSHPAMQEAIGPDSPAFQGPWRDVLQDRAEARLSARGVGLAALEAELGLT